MGNKPFKITDSEYEIMNLLWEAGRPLSVTEIRQGLKNTCWEATTIKTLIGRLTEKGALVRSKAGVYLYTPAFPREEYTRSAADSMIKRLFRGSAKALVASLIDSKGLTEQDMEELRELFHVEDAQ